MNNNEIGADDPIRTLPDASLDAQIERATKIVNEGLRVAARATEVRDILLAERGRRKSCRN